MSPLTSSVQEVANCRPEQMGILTYPSVTESAVLHSRDREDSLLLRKVPVWHVEVPRTSTAFATFDDHAEAHFSFLARRARI
jgi:hypothetical protein